LDVIKIDSAFYSRDSSSTQGLLFLIDKKILLDGSVPLYQFIDNAGLDGKSIHKIRAAREFSFGCRAFVKDKLTGDVLVRPESFSELVRYLEEDKLERYRFILDTDDKELLSEIIQQLLYLNIDIEVMLQNEETAIRRMELFLKSFQELTRTIEEARSSIYHAHIDDSMKEYKNSILYLLSDIGGNIREMQVKDLKVAIMALKKSGKSVVVNCLLGDDYTPASIELPTFTTCIYKKSNNGKISLLYKNNTTSFDSPASLKQYVLKEFRHMHADATLDHSDDAMNISYVPTQNSSFPYTIIDTPGPDLAGSHHMDIAYKWIQEADVILFIIDYSKYLTNSEEEFLRDIKNVFEEHRKFYSFIVVVNKLDLMYLSEEKKSALRFIDFLRTKLKELGYKGIVVFGLSALQYLYALKAPQIEGCSNLTTGDGKEFRDQLDQCLLLHQGKDDMTVLSFLDNQIRNLRWFHGKEEATLQDLKDKSGFEQLMRYINYISIEKAQIELLNHKMSIVNRKLADFQNSFIDNLLNRLEQDNLKLDEIISDLTHFIETAMPASGQGVTLGRLLENITKDLSLAQKSLQKVLTMQLDSCAKQLSKIFKSLTGDELLSFQRDGRIAATDGIVYSVGKSVIEKLYAPVLGKYKGSLARELSEKNNMLEEYRLAMDDKITMLNVYLSKNYRLRNGAVSLPKVSDDFTGFCFPQIKVKLDDLFAQALIKDRLVKKRGILGFLILLLSFGFIDIKTGDFAFDEIKLKKALFMIRKGLDDATHLQIEEMHDQLLSHITGHLTSLDQSMSEATLFFQSDYKEIFESFISDLISLREEIKYKIQFLKEAEQGINRFTALWKKINSVA
jgi:tRNA U34 5-carboxymethylaminomethyl modifying GTPase MnmE/TrmE